LTPDLKVADDERNAAHEKRHREGQDAQPARPLSRPTFFSQTTMSFARLPDTY
jgi:hypothetical protein